MRAGTAAAVLLGALIVAAPLSAQDTTATPPVSDSVQVLGPSGALWRSLLVPGWGQAALGRKLAASVFIGWEGVTLGMALKAHHEEQYLQRTQSGRARGKSQQEQDWLVLLAFNHLLSGLEAYVSAHLADFPQDLHIRAAPGGLGASVSIPFRVR